jgi:hypothetical protein
MLWSRRQRVSVEPLHSEANAHHGINGAIHGAESTAADDVRIGEAVGAAPNVRDGERGRCCAVAAAGVKARQCPDDRAAEQLVRGLVDDARRRRRLGLALLELRHGSLEREEGVAGEAEVGHEVFADHRQQHLRVCVWVRVCASIWGQCVSE